VKRYIITLVLSLIGIVASLVPLRSANIVGGALLGVVMGYILTQRRSAAERAPVQPIQEKSPAACAQLVAAAWRQSGLRVNVQTYLQGHTIAWGYEGDGKSDEVPVLSATFHNGVSFVVNTKAASKTHPPDLLDAAVSTLGDRSGIVAMRLVTDVDRKDQRCATCDLKDRLAEEDENEPVRADQPQ
jgi:hypothetical protein